MAKVQAVSTISPSVIMTGSTVTDEHAVKAIEQLNWSFGSRPQMHVSMAVGPKDWATNAPNTMNVNMDGIVGIWIERLRFHIKINVDTAVIQVGSRTYLNNAADTAEVRFTVGATSATLAHVFGDNGSEKSTTLNTSSTGTGWQFVKVEVRKTADGGAAYSDYLRNIRCQDQRILTSLPGVPNE